jgi:DNA-binding NarL/FixJ family response regulator
MLCRVGKVGVESGIQIRKRLNNSPHMVATPMLRKQTAKCPLNARIVIADDHEIVLEGIRRILTRLRPNWEICGEAANGNQTIELVKAFKPNVVVLDITMPGMSGLEAARQIVKFNPACRILIFTVHDSDWLKSEIRDAGAHGYVQKSQVARDLVVAVECLLEGGTFFVEQGPAELYQEMKPRQEPGQTDL